MNLVTGNWIPVIFDDGVTQLVSLKTLYEQAEKISDLVLNPPQRISIMRLLICITQAALDGPENETEWLKCENRIVPESIKYLESRIDKFNLYDDKLPFLQVAGLDAKEKKALDKLDFSSPSASTLFDHKAATSTDRMRGDAWKAVNLITLLNFNATGKVGQAIWNGVNCNFATYPTPCIGHAHSLMKGITLLRTLFFNILTKDEIISMPNGSFGKPVWDCFPKSSDDASAFDNASKTYLGRLVPFSRLILLENKANICTIGPTPQLIIYEGVPAFREATTTILMSKKNEPYCMKISSEKHIWRDLGALLFLSNSMKDGGAVNIRKVNKLSKYIEGDNIDIWVGGLELGAQAAKLHDLVEWNMSIPLCFLSTDNSPLSLYLQGVQLSDKGNLSLWSAVRQYCNEMKMDNSLSSKARLHYWQDLDNSYQILINAVTEGKSLDEDWYKKIFTAMHSAFRYSCPCDTPRQIQAYAQAEQRLQLKKIEKTDG